MSRILLMLVICVLSSGCAISEQFKSRGQLSTLSKPEDLTRACDLFIIRNSAMFGAAIKYTVALDFQDFVVMTIGDSINVKLSPGPHIITAKYPRQMFLGTAESTLEINCQFNEPVYIYMTAGISVGLEVLSAEKGAELVRDSDPINLK